MYECYVSIRSRRHHSLYRADSVSDSDCLSEAILINVTNREYVTNRLFCLYLVKQDLPKIVVVIIRWNEKSFGQPRFRVMYSSTIMNSSYVIK